MKKCIIRHLVLSISILLTSCHKTVDKSVTPNALGDRFLQQKDYDEAIYSFEKTLAQNENDLHALVGLYYSYFYQQNWLACEDIINKASSLISNNDISSFEQEDLVAIQEGEKKISSILMNPISAEYTGGRIDYIYEYDEEGNVTYWNKKYASGTRPLTVEFYDNDYPKTISDIKKNCFEDGISSFSSISYSQSGKVTALNNGDIAYDDNGIVTNAKWLHYNMIVDSYLEDIETYTEENKTIVKIGFDSDNAGQTAIYSLTYDDKNRVISVEAHLKAINDIFSPPGAERTYHWEYKYAEDGNRTVINRWERIIRSPGELSSFEELWTCEPELNIITAIWKTAQPAVRDERGRIILFRDDNLNYEIRYSYLN